MASSSARDLHVVHLRPGGINIADQMEWRERGGTAYEARTDWMFRFWCYLNNNPCRPPLAKLAQIVGLIFTGAATNPDAMLCIKCAYLLCTERRPSVHKALSVSFDGQCWVLFSLLSGCNEVSHREYFCFEQWLQSYKKIFRPFCPVADMEGLVLLYPGGPARFITGHHEDLNLVKVYNRII